MLNKIKAMLFKVAYSIGYCIGRVLGLFIVGKRKKDKNVGALIQCSQCGSKRIKVTSTIAEEDLKDSGTGIDYKVYTYSVKCMDCHRCATFKEKWEKEASKERIYLNVVSSLEGQCCPYCECDKLVPADDKTIVRIPDGFKLYMCSKCGMPVCVTCDEETLKEMNKTDSVIKDEVVAKPLEEKEDEHCCNCEHCHCHDDEKEGDEEDKSDNE